jgi:triacylglycerol lipase
MKNVTLLAGIALSVLSVCGSAGCAADAAEEVASTEVELSAAAPLGADPKGSPARYPIVLAHGFLGNGGGFASFNASIAEGLERDGHVVVTASVPPLGNVRIRARALADDIDEALNATGAKKVNVFAHSMGGLDARDVVSGLGYGDRVASVTTISTPHRGSRIADVSLGLVGGAREEALDAFGKIVDDDPNTVDVKGALRDLSEANAEAFAASHPDDARVYYQSWAGVSSLFAIPNPADEGACEGKLLAHRGRADLMSPILAPAAPIVAHGVKAEPNDGFVTVASAKLGNFRGCVPADHADEIGVFARESYNRRTGFDFVRFHRNVAFDLAARGF